MRLYHFTSEFHLPSIQRSGALKMSDGWLTGGRDALWLLDTPEATEYGHGLDSVVDKRAVRITVDVPDDTVHRWLDWLATQELDEFSQVMTEAGIKTGGGPEAAAHWWVSFQPIGSEHWVAVETAVEAS